MAMCLSVKLKYPQRLFLWLLGYSMLLVGCFIGFQYHREKEFKAAGLNARLQVVNTRILDIISRGETDRPVSVSKPQVFDDLRVTVVDTLGNVIYDNAPDVGVKSNHLTREEIRQARNSGSGFTVRRHSETTGNTYFYSATMGDNGLIVRTAVPYSVSLAELLHADMGFLWIMGAVTLIMCLLGFFATRRIGLYILRLNRFAEKAEKGERIYDTAPFPKDELGSISNHIVRLYANLQQAVADRDREHKAALYQQREKERIKKQLTNNINHELKTPVASIHVCLEILMNNSGLDEERRREFLRRCFANTVRLKRLLQDVSLITRLDDAPASISKERINLTEIADDVTKEYDTMAGSRGMMVVNNIQQPLIMEGNRSLMESVFQNLISNAIAYSGGTKVEISALPYDGGQITITVEDDGAGVPPEHLPHLFERFYRIDKGRSRAAGGTGLGLSIVKNAVQFNGGSISVNKRKSGGLVFTIRLAGAVD